MSADSTRNKHAYCVYLTTVESRDDAVGLSHKLVREKLVACVNIILGVASVYLWEGEVQEEREFILLMKSERRQRQSIETFVKEHHPYDCPELIELDIAWGQQKYLDWISESLARP